MNELTSKMYKRMQCQSWKNGDIMWRTCVVYFKWWSGILIWLRFKACRESLLKPIKLLKQYQNILAQILLRPTFWRITKHSLLKRIVRAEGRRISVSLIFSTNNLYRNEVDPFGCSLNSLLNIFIIWFLKPAYLFSSCIVWNLFDFSTVLWHQKNW